MKSFKSLGLFLALVLVLLAIAGSLRTTLFESEWLKREVAQRVLAQKQRTLRIDGELTVRLWPRLAIRLGHTTLSEHGSTQAFATLDGAQFALQWLPLLSRRVVIDEIKISGLHADIVRDRAGHLNIADFLEPSQPSTSSVDIGALHLAQARLAWRDEQAGTQRDLALDELDLRCGRIADIAQGQLALSAHLRAAGTPPADAQIKLAATYDLDRTQQRYALSQLRASLAGQLAGMTDAALTLETAAARYAAQPTQLAVRELTLHARGRQGANTFDLKFGTPALQLAAGKLSSDKLTLSAAAQSGSAGSTALQATLAAPLVADLAAATLTLPELRGDLAIVHPRLVQQPLKLPLQGRLRANLKQHTADGELASQLDATRLAARFTLQQRVPLALDFVVDVDRLDLDRYLRAAPPTRAEGRSAQPATAPLPNLHGTLNIAALQFAGVKANKLHLAVTTADGQLTVAPQPPR